MKISHNEFHISKKIEKYIRKVGVHNEDFTQRISYFKEDT